MNSFVCLSKRIFLRICAVLAWGSIEGVASLAHEDLVAVDDGTDAPAMSDTFGEFLDIGLLPTQLVQC